MSDPVEILKLLGDLTRIRILLLLKVEELSVAELQEILDMGQSRISSHLAILRQADLVEDRRDGKRSYYTLKPIIKNSGGQLVMAALQAVEEVPVVRQDLDNLAHIISRRKQKAEAYFNTVAGKLGKDYCPGRSWEAMGHLLLQLTPHIDIADLGAGEGVLSQLLARRARMVYCIDNSPRMVEVGLRLAKDNEIENLTYHLGDLESVPLPDESVDLALLSQALHHAQHPPKALAEAFRILRPGGQVLILDLNKHQFEKARELYADQWLGFQPNQLRQWMKEAGFAQLRVDIVSKETQEPFFETLLAAGEKP
jgi:ArsR family transcriptional regulator